MSPPLPFGLPGDPTPDERIGRIVRVDHAGEYGARRIYQGQLAVLHGTPVAPVIEHMAAQEEAHLAYFAAALPERGARPSLLQPFWHVGGWALGAATAALGTRAAMACTVAVETEIVRHYHAQAAALGADEPALKEHILRFAAEEDEHKDTGLAHEAEQAPAYALLERGIRALCRVAIRVAERV